LHNNEAFSEKVMCFYHPLVQVAELVAMPAGDPAKGRSSSRTHYTLANMPFPTKHIASPDSMWIRTHITSLMTFFDKRTVLVIRSDYHALAAVIPLL
jgi:hypothetical protein